MRSCDDTSQEARTHAGRRANTSTAQESTCLDHNVGARRFGARRLLSFVVSLGVIPYPLAAQSWMSCNPRQNDIRVGIFMVNLKHSPLGNGQFTNLRHKPGSSLQALKHYFAEDGSGSVNEFVQENSFHRARLTGQIIGTVVVDDPEPDNENCFSGFLLAQVVDAAATEHGLHFGQDLYDIREYITPPRLGCKTAHSGAADDGAPVSIFGAGVPSPSHAGHEFGKTVGLGQSMLDLEVGHWGDHETQEYGDVLGDSSRFYHFNAIHKDQLGWLREERKVFLEGPNLPPGAMDIELGPLERDREDDPRPQAVIISFPDGSPRAYYLSTRVPEGFDLDIDDDPPQGFGGWPYLHHVAVHWFERYCPFDDSNPAQHRSYLLASLETGQPFTPTWPDPSNNRITLEQIHGAGKGVWVRIIVHRPRPE